MAEEAKVLRCIILTLRNENVIVPSASVAEIISVKGLESAKNSPEWLLGNMEWRGFSIPLMSYEAAEGGKAKEVNINTQAAVLYAIGEKMQETPYMAVVISGMPHVSKFTSEQIKTDSESIITNPMVAQKVRVNGAAASILNLDAMERMLSEAGV